MPIAEHMHASHGSAEADRLLARAAEAKQQSDVIRRLVMDREPVPVEKD